MLAIVGPPKDVASTATYKPSILDLIPEHGLGQIAKVVHFIGFVA